MILCSQNAALSFDAFFLSIPRYWMRAMDHTLGRSMQEMWWCVLVHVHAHALHQLYTSQSYTAQRGAVESAILCSLGCSCNPNILKNGISSICVAQKNGPRTPTITFFWKVPSLWVVLGQQLSQGFLYELWCHNNQAQTNLTYNLGTIASKIRLTRVILESCGKYSHSLQCRPGWLRLTSPVPPVSLSQPVQQWRECEYSQKLSRMTRVNLILEAIVPPTKPPTTYIPTTTFIKRNCLHESRCDIRRRMTFPCNYVWWIPRYTWC